MTDYVFSAADYATVEAVAQQLGGFDADAQTIKQTGIVTSGGNWFFNYFGPVDGLSGVWGRLRLNGDSDLLSSLLPGVMTIYAYSDTLGGWTADGLTIAPAFVEGIGLIL